MQTTVRHSALSSRCVSQGLCSRRQLYPTPCGHILWTEDPARPSQGHDLHSRAEDSSSYDHLGTPQMESRAGLAQTFGQRTSQWRKPCRA